MWIFVNALIENPTFDSQTKENMTLQVKSFGSTCQLSEKFIKAVSTQKEIKDRSIFLYFPLPFSTLQKPKFLPRLLSLKRKLKKQPLPLTNSYQALNYHLYAISIYLAITCHQFRSLLNLSHLTTYQALNALSCSQRTHPELNQFSPYSLIAIHGTSPPPKNKTMSCFSQRLQPTIRLHKPKFLNSAYKTLPFPTLSQYHFSHIT